MAFKNGQRVVVGNATSNRRGNILDRKGGLFSTTYLVETTSGDEWLSEGSIHTVAEARKLGWNGYQKKS